LLDAAREYTLEELDRERRGDQAGADGQATIVVVDVDGGFPLEVEPGPALARRCIGGDSRTPGDRGLAA
jgi:hypothetical protein